MNLNDFFIQIGGIYTLLGINVRCFRLSLGLMAILGFFFLM
jgi:hypothetical protein